MESSTSQGSTERAVERIDRLGYFLDNAIRIPIIGYRIGWDAILGLVPGLGDAAGVLLSSYIVFESARLGAPGKTLARMIVNVVIEALVGAIPILGDVFDATWKANARNVDLLHQNMGVTRPRRTISEKRILIAVVVALVLLFALLVFVIVMVVQAILGMLAA